MKKNGKTVRQGNNESAGSAERLRNRKTYLNRLEELGLHEPPAVKRVKMPSALELARLAAALEKDSTSGTSAGELAARAREIWKAAADAPYVEGMAEFIVNGLCVFDKHDWTRHCLALIGLLNDAEGAVPGLRSSGHYVKSIRRAQMRASMAVAQTWRRGERAERGDQVIRALFPAKSETEESRRKKLIGLLQYACKMLGCRGEVAWPLKYGIGPTATLVTAWMPLTVPPEDAAFIEAAAKAWMDFPEGVEIYNLAASPVLARWLAVIRMKQLRESKRR